MQEWWANGMQCDIYSGIVGVGHVCQQRGDPGEEDYVVVE